MTTTCIAVAGGGPAGTAISLRLAQLGHDVVLVTRTSSRRSHSVETLTPGVSEQLKILGLGDTLDGGLVLPAAERQLKWQGDRFEPNMAVKPGALVERSAFEAGLIAAVKRHGVSILSAEVRRAERIVDGWRLGCESAEGPVILTSSFLVDATGRRGLLPRKRLRKQRLLGVRGRWRGARLPSCVRVAADDQFWAWGAPTVDHTYEGILFLDPSDLDRSRTSLEQRYRFLASRCGLLDGAQAAECIGPVQACDATPYVELDAAGEDYLKIGDASLTVDPLSSAGVQIALQSAVSGAAAVNTLREDPAATGLVTAFWARELARRSTRHAKWSAEFYRTAAARFATPFWQSRAAANGNGRPLADPANREMLPRPDQALQLSGSVEIADAPCVVGNMVELRRTVAHPSLNEPVAFLDGADLPRILASINPGATAAGILRLWLRDIEPRRGIAILSWIWRRGLIEPVPAEGS